MTQHTSTSPSPSPAAPIPTRYPSSPLPVPASIRMLAAAFRVGPATPTQFERYGEALTLGDPLMDELVDWMFRAGRKQGRELFERALAGGIAAVPDAPAPLRAVFEELESTPDWVDWDLIEHAGKLSRANGADGVYLGRDVALHGGYLFSGFNQTLLRTGALEKGSNQRFAETTQWVLDTIAPGGLRPGGAGFRSTIRVRMIHSFVRRHVSAMPDWDAGAWGLPVNQTDMAATIHGTFIVPTAAGVSIGQLSGRRDLESMAHLTRYVGWLIGVREEFLPRDFREAVQIQAHTLAALATPDETSRMLAMPMADDPLQWTFPRFQGLRRRIAYSQHLSLTQATIGRRAMRQLGLTPRLMPWYPVVRLPVNLTRSALRQLPGGLDRAAARGDREQARVMARMTSTPALIGGSVGGL